MARQPHAGSLPQSAPAISGSITAARAARRSSRSRLYLAYSLGCFLRGTACSISHQQLASTVLPGSTMHLDLVRTDTGKVCSHALFRSDAEAVIIGGPLIEHPLRNAISALAYYSRHVAGDCRPNWTCKPPQAIGEGPRRSSQRAES